ncbi:MBL fold metallo-hydrolase [Silvibacterium acidisoli]|uniref:MBL fold metallo-hydrolase n=1 Tax=Acidobacteriaceae bacterium ZG23-2 TaxID=2883246 RepID=UPI00406C3BBF
MPSSLGARLRFASHLIVKSSLKRPEGVQRKPVLVKPDEIGITFIGHASFLLQAGGKNILIDPVFAYWLVFIHRLRKPGVRISDLPPIDLVLLTHAHMDHLNFPSLRKIIRHTQKLSGHAPAVILPWEVADLVGALGFKEIHSLRWWQTMYVEGLEITMTPAQHWGARMLKDSHRGFGGYVVRSGAGSVYHSGDTGYSAIFREVGARLQPEIALLPIGAYKPDSFRHVHTSPEDALQIFEDLGSRWMIPMHYGTFSLSEEPIEEPLPRLLDAAIARGVDGKIIPLSEGDTRIFPRLFE